MASAATLFFDPNDAERQTLHRRIVPSDTQFEEQQDRWNALANHLITDLKERSGYSLRTWLQGSYKFGTQVRPVRLGEEFDIDLGIYYEWDGIPQDGKHSAKTLKNFVQESLKDYASAHSSDVSDVISPPKERCCRIHYKNYFHIDVPAYHLDPAQDIRSLATQKDNWENSDPKSIYLWFRDQFAETARAKVRRHVKYMKAWAALKFSGDDERPSSILLTVLVAEAGKALGEANIGADDDALREILQRIVDRLDKCTDVTNPVDKTENLCRLSDSGVDTLEQRLHKFLETGNRATSQESEILSADIWQESFEHLFPLPVTSESLTKANARLPVPLTLPEIAVTAVSRTNSFVGKFQGLNKIGPIPKDCDIQFEVKNIFAFPSGVQFVWMVRNEGDEAEDINDLGHFAGVGATKKEYSAYRGTHYMDCIVKLGTQTIAMRRVPVVISGKELPRRNPTRKPEYVKLRGRR